MPSLRESSKPTHACTTCREKKVKCNDRCYSLCLSLALTASTIGSGGLTCNNCLRHARTCTYPASRRGKRSKYGHGLDDTLVTSRLADIHVIPYQPSTITLKNERRTATTAHSQRHEPYAQPTPSPADLQTLDQQSANDAFDIQLPAQSFDTSTLVPQDPMAMLDSQASMLSPVRTQTSPSLTTNFVLPPDNETEIDRAELEDEVVHSQKSYWEHLGPWSWVSVCSQPGIQWVCERTHSDDFVEMANGLTKAWSRRLKLKGEQAKPHRSPEPDEATAWRYVKGKRQVSLNIKLGIHTLHTAYFEQSYDMVFGIIHRPTFESRLRKHFRRLDLGQQEEGDAAWFALRNIVYAAGCRCVLAEDSSFTFVEAQTQAFRLFQNALSVFTELTFAYTGLTGVRALTIMVSAWFQRRCLLRISNRASTRKDWAARLWSIHFAPTLLRLPCAKVCIGNRPNRPTYQSP